MLTVLTFPCIWLAHVRSILEYCSLMCSHSRVKGITTFKLMQRQAGKFNLNDYVSPYHERCTALTILPLCFRREIIDMCFLYSYTFMVNYLVITLVGLILG